MRRATQTSHQLTRAGALLASLYTPRRWVILLFGGLAALWLYKSAANIARVYGPPSLYGPAVDYVVPISGANRAIDNQFELDIEVGVNGCENPVRVLATADGPGAERGRNWLRASAAIAFGVQDQSVHGLRTFVGAGFADLRDDHELFDAAFHGNGQLRELPETKLATHSTDLGSGMRGALANAPGFPSTEANPTIYWSFTADWLHPRTFGTCYLSLPLVIGPGPGSPLVQLPRPRQEEYVGTDSASVSLTDWHFTQGPSGRIPTPLTVISEDSRPAPEEPSNPEWTCQARGSERSCNGGYVALSTTNASGTTSTKLFVRGALLGVVAALVAESLLRFRSPLRRRRPTGPSHTGDLPVRWRWRD
jgi:hypothetical protein